MVRQVPTSCGWCRSRPSKSSRSATSTSRWCRTRPIWSRRGSSRRSGPASTPTTARCSRSATSTSSSSGRRITGTRCPMIEAVKSGVDVWVQKPISVDVVEGQAMLAAARKYKRVVQVGMQRRSTPHLIHARDRIIKEGKLGTIGLVEICCYYHMRATQNPPDGPPPANLDYEMWTGPAPMRPVQLARAPAQLAGVHGIRQRDRGRHVRAHAGHGALDAGPRHADAHQLDWRHPRRQEEQGQHHRHADRDVRLSRTSRSSGPTGPTAARPIRTTPGPRRSTATRARSRPASIPTTSSRGPKARRRFTRTSSSSSSSFPKTRPRRISSVTSRRPSAAT